MASKRRPAAGKAARKPSRRRPSAPPSAKGAKLSHPAWWGSGRAPHEEWPGVTLAFEPEWSLQRARWETHEGRYYFDMETADRACDFFPVFLRHHIGEFAGRPFELLDYQRKLQTRPLFGWKRATDDMRRFQKLFGFIPKGAGKSPWAAGTGLYLTACDQEAAAEVYALASDRFQARTVHSNAKVMVEESPDLLEMADILKDSIYFRGTRSSYMVLSSDAASAHGKRPHGLIFDEFHAQRNRDLFEALRKSMAKRRQPVLIIISHAGDDDEGICVAPDTKLLTSDLRWVRAADVAEGDVLAGFDEHRPAQGHRRWQRARVLERSVAWLPSYEIELTDGTRVVCSEDHMWLVQTAGRRVVWRKTKDLQRTDAFFKVLDVWATDTSRDGGYLAGLLDGEGHLSSTTRAKALCGFTQRDNVVSAAGQAILTAKGLRWGVYGGAANGRSARQTMVTRKRDVFRMLGSVRPARLLETFGRVAYGEAGLRFKATEHPTLRRLTFLGRRRVVGLKTSTRTFVAEGLASHNCFEEYELAKRVLSGTVADETALPVIFEARPEDDWTDPDLWRRVNPGHGITIQHLGIQVECEEAKAEPRKVNDFLRYHLNRWTNQATAWIPLDWWDACTAPMPSDDVLAKLPCAVGIDMAQKIDLAAAVAVFRLPLEDASPLDPVEIVVEDDNGEVIRRTLTLNYRLAILPAFWIPEDTMVERARKDGVRYPEWRTAGFLNVTDGAIVDSESVARHVYEGLPGRFPLVKQAEIGYDPAFATEVHVRLAAKGFKTVEVLQNYKYMSEACQVFEALVKAKRILHGGHPLLRWNLENVAVKTDDAGRIRPVKPKHAAKRIDGVVATLMAIFRLMSSPLPPAPPPRPKVSVISW